MERVSPVDVSVPALRPPLRAVQRPSSTRPAAVLAAVTLAATALAVDPGGMRPFTSLRWALTSSAIAAAGLVVAGRRGGHALPRWAVVAGGVVVTSTAVSAAVVGEAATAWLGHPQRHLGVLAWVVFAVAALVGASLAGDEGGERLLARAALGAGAVTTVAALADLAGWAPLGTDFAGGRVGGLLGQPTTLAAVAVLLAPLAAVARAGAQLRAGVVAGLVLTVLATQTRGALLGLVAAAAVSLPALRPLRRRGHLVAVALIAVAVATTPVADRLADVGGSGRLDEWRLAARVVADRPLLGVGPEGYRLAAPAELDQPYVAEHGRDVVVDRAHAAPLDVAAAGGVAAAVGHLALVAGVATATWRLQRRRPWSVPAAAGAGATAALVAELLAFPTVEVDPVAWLLGGMALAAASERPTRPTARRLGAIAASTLAITCVVTGATDVRADRDLGAAVDLTTAGRHADALELADRATRLRPDLLDGWYVAARVASSGGTILDLDAGIERVVEGRRRSAGDPALRRLHAELVVERALRSGLARDHAVAAAVVEQALAADPTDPALHDLVDRLGVRS